MRTMMTNIFFKDCRRLRILLTAFFLVLAAELTAFSPVIQDHLPALNAMKDALGMLKVFHFFLVWVLIGLLVQEDPVTDHRAFWLTRPVSRWDLLISKTFFVLVFTLIIPAVCYLGILKINGLDLHIAFDNWPDLLRERAFFLLAFTLIAGMTRSFVGYAFASAGFLFCASYFQYGFNIFFYDFIPGCLKAKLIPLFQNPRMGHGSTAESVLLMENLVNALFGIFLLIHQFISRNSAKTLKWLGVWIVMAFLVSRFWFWDFYHLPGLDKNPLADVISIEIEDLGKMDTTFLSDDCQDPFREQKRMLLGWPLTVHNLPPGQYARLTHGHSAQFILPGRIDIREDEDYSMTYTVYNGLELWQIPSWKDVLPQTRIVDRRVTDDQFVYFLPIQKRDLQRYGGQKGTLIATIDIELNEWGPVLRLPLSPGAEAGIPGKKITLAGFLKTPAEGKIALIVQEKEFLNQDGRSYSNQYILLRNRLTGEALVRYNNKSIAGAFRSLSLFPSWEAFTNDFQTYAFEIPSSDTRDWLEHGELVIVYSRYAGDMEKELFVRNVPLQIEKEWEQPVINGFTQVEYPTGEKHLEFQNIFSRRPVPAREFYRNGELAKEAVYCGGVKQGPAREYYSTGELMYEYNYAQGLIQGPVRKYDRSGQLLSEKMYDRGRPVESKRETQEGSE